MLSKHLLLVAPFLLASPASALPKQLAERDAVQVECSVEVVTITQTVYGDDAKTDAPVIQASPTAPTEHYSPVGPAAGAAAPTAVVASPADSSPAAVSPPSSDTSVQNNPGTSNTAPVVVTSPDPAPATTPPQTNAPQTSNGKGYKNVLYFTNWGIYGANYQPQQLPASQVTHVLYSFADIGPDGEVKSSDTYADLEKHYPTDSWNDQGKNAYGCVKQLYLLKKQNRQMKVLLSIGGWTYSPKFAPVAATEAGRQKFASSALALVKDWGLDGIDIDWEYPANADEAQNFVKLLQTCRQAFDNYAAQSAPGYHFIISVASPAGPKNYQNMDMAGMDPLVDIWNLMAYDYAGSWDSTSGHQANLFPSSNNPISTPFSTEKAVGDYIGRGISPSKIMMGLPLYGRSFEATTGLGAPYNGIGAGSIQSGVWLYKDLPRPGAQETYDDVAKASYSYDPSSKELISYDTVNSAVNKANYLKSKGLGGAVFWEASGDRAGAGSLVGTLAQQFGSLDNTPNLLSYPASQYDNIRNGMPGA